MCGLIQFILWLETEYTEDNPKIVLQCGHIFHLAFIYEWMERSKACPFCSKVLYIRWHCWLCLSFDVLFVFGKLYFGFDVNIFFVIFTENAFLGGWNYRSAGITRRDILGFFAAEIFLCKQLFLNLCCNYSFIFFGTSTRFFVGLLPDVLWIWDTIHLR